MNIDFYKYHGTGNDFIIIDNRNKNFSVTTKQIANLCHRRFGIGADGLILLELENGYDFKMVYYNSDGHPSSMCGNGGRCITQFAHDIGIQKKEYHFNAIDGEHISWIDDHGIVWLKMKNLHIVENHNNYTLLNTGSPHFIKTVTDLDIYPVYKEGHEIRNSEKFEKEGINVNFVEVLDHDKIFVRTYERGVEDETYSCGTGVTAAALVHAHNERGFNHIDIKTLGGELFVEFDKLSDDHFENIWLCGSVVKVFEGKM